MHRRQAHQQSQKYISGEVYAQETPRLWDAIAIENQEIISKCLQEKASAETIDLTLKQFQKEKNRKLELGYPERDLKESLEKIKKKRGLEKRAL